MNKKIRKTAVVPMIHILLILTTITMLVPFLWMVLTAFKTTGEAIAVDPFVIFPRQFRPDSFRTVVNNMDFLLLYKNTILMMMLRILCAVVTASMSGFAFGRLQFRGRNFAFGLVLFQMMIPSQIFIIPQYQMISRMNMNNTMFALLFPGLVTAFGTFLMRQAYMSLPRELEEASRLDGCSIGQTFLYILTPLTKSSMVALGIFTAVFAYKDLMWPLIVNTSKEMLVLSSALAGMQGQYTSKYPELMAASLIACLPMIVIYLIFQKHLIEGIATSGGKL